CALVGTNIIVILLLMQHPPPLSTLFPYTTLFRSARRPVGRGADRSGLRDARPRRHTQQESPRRERHSVGVDGRGTGGGPGSRSRSEEHTSELQSRFDLVCRLLLEKKKTITEASRY